MEEWGEWCAVIVTAIVSMTAPINKKQKKVGMKYLAKILWESSLILLVQCSLAFLLYGTCVTNTIAYLKDITHLPRNS